jgi:hypothetical protein
MSEKKAELIAQLLAKAESTTPEEAEALMEHAARLAAKYMIDQATIDAKRAKAGQPIEQIVTKTVTFTGAYRLEWIALGVAVCNGLGNLRNLQSTFKNKAATLYVIGYESDVEQALILINSLQVQATVAVRAWWKENKVDFMWETSYDQEAARRSFAKGFGFGAGARIKENKNQVVQEAGTGTDLVLASRDAKVQEHFDGISTRANRSRGGKGSFGAMSAGREAGRNANTGDKGLTGGRGIEA